MINTKIEAIFWILITLIVAMAVVAYKHIETTQPPELQAFEQCMSFAHTAGNKATYAEQCTDITLKFKGVAHVRGR